MNSSRSDNEKRKEGMRMMHNDNERGGGMKSTSVLGSVKATSERVIGAGSCGFEGFAVESGGGTSNSSGGDREFEVGAELELGSKWLLRQHHRVIAERKERAVNHERERHYSDSDQE